MDVNAVVSFNLRTIRERRGWTQQDVAERLARLTGHRLPQASISAMERGFDGDRRRRFDAHELYLLSMVFGVPIAYFFLPPPDTGLGELADTNRPIAELYVSVLGREYQLDELDERLAELNITNPETVDDGRSRHFRQQGGSRTELARPLPHLAQEAARGAGQDLRRPPRRGGRVPRRVRQPDHAARPDRLPAGDGPQAGRRTIRRSTGYGGVTMRGSVVKKGDRWYVKIELDPDPATGQRRQKWHSGYRTKRDAERARIDLLSKFDRGEYVEPSHQTLGEFLTEWLVAIEPTVRHSTFDSYSRNVRNHVIAHIGSVRLTKVDAGVLNGLYATLLASGRRPSSRKGAGYSAGGRGPGPITASRRTHALGHRDPAAR